MFRFNNIDCDTSVNKTDLNTGWREMEHEFAFIFFLIYWPVLFNLELFRFSRPYCWRLDFSIASRQDNGRQLFVCYVREFVCRFGAL